MSTELKILQLVALMLLITIQVIVIFKYLLPKLINEWHPLKGNVRVKKGEKTLGEGKIYTFIPDNLIVLENEEGKMKSILLEDKNIRIEEVKQNGT